MVVSLPIRTEGNKGPIEKDAKKIEIDRNIKFYVGIYYGPSSSMGGRNEMKQWGQIFILDFEIVR